jgi:hypothetical protein
MMARTVGRLFLVDTSKLTSRLLWDAPFDFGAQRISWSPDSNHVLITSAFYPLGDNDSKGRMGEGAAVVDVSGGSYEKLPLGEVKPALLKGWRSIWLSNDAIELVIPQENRPILRERFSHDGTHWRATDAPSVLTPRRRRIELKIKQTINDPPRIYARDVLSGRERMLYDPNPHLTEDFTLGKVRYLVGDLPDGGTWEGWIYYPTRYEPGHRYPMVIQSDRGIEPADRFSL